MNALWKLFAIAGLGSLGIGDALAVPPAPAPERPSPVILAQASDRIARLWQHRSIIEEALQPGRMGPGEPLEPEARALLPPDPTLPPNPDEPAPAPENDLAVAGPAEVGCEEAAAVVREFGFSDVRETSCSGELYWFSAMRDEAAYAIGITAAGEVAEVRRQH